VDIKGSFSPQSQASALSLAGSFSRCHARYTRLERWGSFCGEMGLFLWIYRALFHNNHKRPYSLFWVRTLLSQGVMQGIHTNLEIGLFCGNVELFCGEIGLFCAGLFLRGLCKVYTSRETGLFGREIRLFCEDSGLFCGEIGLFCGYTGLFLTHDIHV